MNREDRDRKDRESDYGSQLPVSVVTPDDADHMIHPEYIHDLSRAFKTFSREAQRMKQMYVLAVVRQLLRLSSFAGFVEDL